MSATPTTVNRGLLWADATFYAACSSAVMCVALTNTLPRAATLLTPNVLDHVPLLAALHHSGYRSLYYVVVSFLVNALPHILSAMLAALVFLIAQRPRSLVYSTVIMAPQILIFAASAFDGHRLTGLWATTELTWVVMGIAVFHALSIAASRVAAVTLGRDTSPGAAPLLRTLGVILAIGPALYLVLEAHQYLWSGFKPAMRVLVPLGVLILCLLLAIRYGSRPAVMAGITAAAFLMFMFAGELLGPAG